ncbi:MAG: helix-turn-helix domain-containing protein, partial [Candidatus Binataceae bacterium]
KRIGYIAGAALAALKRYDWPGNVREFGHAIQSAVMLSEGDRIFAGDLPDYLLHDALGMTECATPEETPEESPNPEGNGHWSLNEVVSKASKAALLRALHETHGNCHRAAQLLGVSRYTVYRMIARYGVGPRRQRADLPTDGTEKGGD